MVVIAVPKIGKGLPAEVLKLVTCTMVVVYPEKLTGNLFPYFPLKFCVRATVAGRDNVKNRLHDTLLQNGKDALLAVSAG